MNFSVGDVAQRGFDRISTPIGAVVVAALAVIGIGQTAVWQDLVRNAVESILEELETAEWRDELTSQQLETLELVEETLESFLDELHLALGLDASVAWLLWIVLVIAWFATIVMAYAAFGNEVDDVANIVPERLGWKTLNLFVGMIVFGFLFTIGLILLIIPGVLFAIFMVFFPAVIAIRGESFFSAYATSASVVRDNVLSTLGLIVLSLVVLIILALVGGVVGGVGGAIFQEILIALGTAYVFAMFALGFVSATSEASDSASEDDEESIPAS